MTSFTPADRARLVAILGLLGSDHDGERASAGLLATRMLRQRGLQWIDLIADCSVPPPPPSASRAVTLWRADLALAQRHLTFCRPWEQQFLRSVAQRPSLSPKQRLVLGEIATALRARGME
jgi:hypothetical protein